MSRHAIFGLGAGYQPSGAATAGRGAAAAPASNRRVLLYGDSLTAGYPHYEPYAKTFVSTCASAGVDMALVGCGLCGLTARDMAANLTSRGVDDSCGRSGVGLQKLLEDESADEGPFDVVLIMAGANDILEELRGPEEILEDIQRLHAASLALCARTVALSVADFRCRSEPQRAAWRELNRRLEEWARGSAGSRVHFVDSARLLPHDESTGALGAWEEDGIHFSEDGSAMFGTALAQAVLPPLFGAALPPGTGGDMYSLAEEKLPHTSAAAVASCREAHGHLSNPALSPGPGDMRCLGGAAASCGDVPRAGTGRVLVLGSSVARGSGAPADLGWAQLLAAAAERHGVGVSNEAVDGATTDSLQAWLCGLADGYLDAYSTVVVSLSPADHGLCCCRTPEQLEEVQQSFVEGLQMLSFLLRGMTRPGARLVFGGPHPHNGYAAGSFEVLVGILEAMRSFEEVEHVIDFLQPAVHDGHGHWAPGLASNDEHPNEMGHGALFHCLNLRAVLGLP